MRPSGLSLAVFLAGLALPCAKNAVRPEVASQSSLGASAVLEETSRDRTAFRASQVREQNSTREEDVQHLKKQIDDLKAERKGLVAAVRKLLNGSKSATQQRLVRALRGTRLQVEEAEKKLTTAKEANKVEIAKLQIIIDASQQDLEKERTNFGTLSRREITENKTVQFLRAENRKLVESLSSQASATADVRRKAMENVSNQSRSIALLSSKVAAAKKNVDILHSYAASNKSENEKLRAQIKSLQERSAALEADRVGMKHTLDKFWHVTATQDEKALLKTVLKQKNALEVLRAEKVKEEANFSSESRDLSSRLNESEHKRQVDEQELVALRVESEQLRNNQSALTKAVTQMQFLQTRNKYLSAELSYAEAHQSAELQAALKREASLRAEAKKEQVRDRESQQTFEKVLAAGKTYETKLAAMKAAKEADETLFAQELIGLQAKVNSTREQLQKKEAETEAVKARGYQYYAKNFEKERKNLQSKIREDEVAKRIEDAKLEELSVSSKEAQGKIIDLLEQKKSLEGMLQDLKGKLAYAEDKENIAMRKSDRLEAEERNLTAALKNQSQLEPRFERLRKHDQQLQTLNRKLLATERSQRSEIEQMKNRTQHAEKKLLQEQSKLDFAVDQENTEMLAVQVLRGENKHLKEGLANLPTLQAQVKQEQADKEAKDITIKEMQHKYVNSNEQAVSLMNQIKQLKKKSGDMEAQYSRERSKLANIVDKDTTATLALQVLQGENQRLKQKLQQTATAEAALANQAKVNRVKADESDTLKAQGEEMKSALAMLRQREVVLTHQNQELKDTVASMAVESQAEQAPQSKNADEWYIPPKPPAPRPVGLKQATLELTKLMTQFRKVRVQDSEGDDDA